MDANHNILFVDDDGRLLRGLQRALGSQVGFGLYFAQRGEKAFDIIRDRQIDFVISGVEVGDMAGSRLLERVREMNPSSVRVMFSECSSDDPGVDNPVHMYIDRPCDSTGIMSILQSLSQRLSLVSVEYRHAVSVAKLPPIRPETIDFVRDYGIFDSSDEELIDILAHDPGFLLLAIYRQRRNIDRINFHDLKDMVRKIVDRDKFLHDGVLNGGVRCTSNCYLEDLQEEVYEHSLLTAGLACDIAGDRFGERSNIIRQALLAGLLHDIGKVIIAEQYAQQCRLAVPYEYDAGLLKSKDGIVIDHYLFGSMLFGLWGLHGNIVDAIAGMYGATEVKCNVLREILVEADSMAQRIVVN